jgi:hypothetical protein
MAQDRSGGSGSALNVNITLRTMLVVSAIVGLAWAFVYVRAAMLTFFLALFGALVLEPVVRLMVEMLAEDLQHAGVEFLLARDVGQVQDILRRQEVDQPVAIHTYPTVKAVVDAARRNESTAPAEPGG